MKKADRAGRRKPMSGWTVLRHCTRRGLLQSTALQAVAAASVLAGPLRPLAVFALSPTTQPTGGQVVAGQAGIAQTPTQTTVTQSTQNAAVNWQTYNVGRNQTVQYVDPSSTSMTLNRVVGPNPSEIAGRITSNGTVVIVNQAGMVFDRGAQVNVTGLVASAAGITNSNFMAGHAVFDQPANPGAKIVNNGTITIRDRGLATLVAPRVRNAGTIQAKLGTVVLGGAEAYSLDLYGDGMVGINVTKQVATAPDGGKALVTNDGVIAAAGGTVLLTANAVDGVVQTLVNAGGSISADSVGGRPGRVVIVGAGGDLEVTGSVSANGIAPRTTGGAVAVNTTGTVTLASSARVSASGPAGGGTIAIGTTPARAKGGPSVTSTKTAKAVAVQHGATIAADAMAKGDGGVVTLLSTNSTVMNGLITAKGGPQRGNGGFVEVSGGTLRMTTGVIDVSAPQGSLGTILLDPDNLNIVASGGNIDGTFAGTVTTGQDSGSTDSLSAGVLSGFTGNVLLQAKYTIDVQSSFSIGAGSLTLEAGNFIRVDPGVSAGASGDIILATGGAGPGTPPAPSGSPSILMGGTLVSGGGSVGLLAGPGGGITIANPGTVKVSSGKSITLQADSLSNEGTVVAPSGTIEIAPATSGNAVAFGTGGPCTLLATASSLSNTSASNLRIGAATINGVQTTTAGSIVFDTNVNLSGIAGTLDLHATGAVSATNNGALAVGTLTGSSSLLDLLNSAGTSTIGTIGSYDAGSRVGGGFDINLAGSVAFVGPVSGHDNSIYDTGGINITGTLSAPGSLLMYTPGAITVSGTAAITGPLIFMQGNSGISLTGSALIGQAGGTVGLGSGFSEASTGTIMAGTLYSDGGASTGSLLGTANAIDTIGSLSASGTFLLVDRNALTVAGTLSASGGIFLRDSNAAGITIAATGSILAGSGTASLQSDQLAIGGTISGATIELAPVTSGNIVNIGTGTGGLQLTQSLLNHVHATVLRIGGVSSNGTIMQTAGSISIQGAVDLAGISSALDLQSTGAVTETIADRLDNIGTLTGNTGAVHLAGLKSSGLTTIGNYTVTGGDFTGIVTGPTGISGTLIANNVGLSTVGASVISVTGTVAAIGTVTFSSGSIALGGASDVHGTALGLSGVTGISMVGAGVLGQPGQTVLLDVTTSAGDFTEPATATINAATLQSTGGITGSINLLGTGNVIGSLGAFSLPGSGFSIITTGSLSVGNAITAQTISLNAGTLGITGNLNAGGQVALGAGVGGITEAGDATIAAGRLTSIGTVVGGATLSGANTIATLGSFAVSGGNFALVDTESLSVAGLVTAPTISLNGATIGVPGTLNAGTLLALGASAGGVTETGGISAGTLTSLGTIAGGVTLSGTNTIATLGSFATSGGDFTLVDTGSLRVSGPVVAPDISLSAGTVAITGTLSAGTILALGAGAGGINGTAGALNAATLVSIGTIVGGAALTGTNTITVLGTVAVTGGNLDVNDTGTLDVRGSVSAPDILLSVAGSIALDGTLNAGTMLAMNGSLAAGGRYSIFENATAVINAPTLESIGTLAGGLAMAQGSNTIATLGPIVAANAIVLHEPGSLTVVGPVMSPAVTLSAGTIGITGNLIGISNVALAASAGGVSEFGTGMIDTPVLSSKGTILGGVTLTGTNTIGALGSLTVSGGNLTLNDTGILSIAGIVSAPIISLDAGMIGIVGNLNAGTLLALGASAGSISQSITSVVDAPTLVSLGTIQSGITLAGTANHIGTIRDFAFTGTFEFTDASALTFAGLFSAPAGATSVIGAPSATITSGGVLNVGTVGITTTAGGVVEEGTGQIVTNSLSIATAGSANVLLTNPNNQILASSGIQVGNGNLVLVDDPTLTLIGIFSAKNLFFQVAQPGDAIALGAAGTPATLSTTASGGRISLVADKLAEDPASTIIASAGTLEIAPYSTTVAVNLGGSAQLAVDPALLGNINTGTSGTLAIGSYTDASHGGMMVVSSSGIVIAGSVDLTGGRAGTLDLATAGSITEPAGLVKVATLTGTAGKPGNGGFVVLNQPGNDIGTLASFAVAGGPFSLSDVGNSGLVMVSGPVTAQSVTITDATAGSITITGSIGAGALIALSSGPGGIIEAGGGVLKTGRSGTVDLSTSAGGVTQVSGAGTIITGTLQSSNGVVGTVSLLSSTNTIAMVGNLPVSGGDFNLKDTGTLTAAGLVGANDIMLNAGAIVLAAASVLSVPTGMVDITTTAGGVIQDPAGTILAATLLSSGGINGGSADLAGMPNAIGTVTHVTVIGGDLNLRTRDAGLLTVAGGTPSDAITADNVTITAGTLAQDWIATATTGAATLTATTGSLSQSGIVSAVSGVTLQAQTDLDNTASGTVTASNGMATLIATRGTLGQAGLVSAGTIGASAGTDLTHGGISSGGRGGVKLAAGDSIGQPDGSIEAFDGNISLNAGASIYQGGIIQTTGTASTTISLVAQGTGTTTGIRETSGGLIQTPAIAVDSVVSLQANNTVDLGGQIRAGSVLDNTGSVTIRAGGRQFVVGGIGGTALLETGTITGGFLADETATVGDIVFGGIIRAGTGGLTFQTLNGSIQQTGGTLQAVNTGTVSLAAAAHLSNSTSGTIALSGASSVIQTGNGNINLAADLLVTQGAGKVQTSGGTVVVASLGTTAGNGITQTGGVIAANGDATLIADNSVNLAGLVSASRDIALYAGGASLLHGGTVSGVTLDQTGTVSGGIGVTETAALGDIVLGSGDTKGTISAGSGGVAVQAMDGSVTGANGIIQATGGLVHLIAQSGNITQTSGLITASDANVTMVADQSIIQIGGTIHATGTTAGAGVSLVAHGSGATQGLELAGTIQALDPSGTVSALAQAGTVTTSGIISGNSLALQSQLDMTNSGNVQGSGGNSTVALTSLGGNLTQSGAVSGSTVSEVAFVDLTHSGTTSAASGSVTLSASNGTFTQTGGLITAVGGIVDVTGGLSVAQTGGTIQTTGASGNTAIALTSNGTSGGSGIIQAAGAVIRAADAGGSVALLSQGSVGVAGTIMASNTETGSVSVTAKGSTLANTGIVTAGRLVALSAQTSLDNRGTVNATNGAATLVANTGALGQTGTVSAFTGGTLTANTDLTNTGSVLVNGPAVLAASTGNLVQNGLVRGNLVSETAGGSVTHGGVSQAVGAGATIVANGATLAQSGVATAVTGATLTAQRDLGNTGSVLVSAGPAALMAMTGNLTQNGAVQGTSVSETAGNSIIQGGTSTATMLGATVTANGSTLTQSGVVSAVANAALSGQTGLFNSGVVSVSGASGQAALVATTGVLTQTGTVQATGAGGTVTVTASAGDIALSGTSSAGAGGVGVTASNGSITQAAGLLQAANGGTVSLAAMFNSNNPGSGTITQIGGTIAAAQAVRLTADQNLMQAGGGTISAPQIDFFSTQGSLTVDGMLSGLLAAVQQASSRYSIPRSDYPVIGGSNIGSTNGIFITVGGSQLPTKQVVTYTANASLAPGALPPSGRPQVVVTVLNNEPVVLNVNTPDTYASLADLFLDMQTGSGSGTINVASLHVEYAGSGTTGQLSLQGTVDGETGSNAAAASFIQPERGDNYLLNGCPIGSSNCVRITTLSVPLGNPLRDIEFGPPPPPADINIILPDVGELDY